MSSHGPVKEHSHKEIMIILSGLMTGLLLAALDQTIVSTALKSIVEDFNGLNHYTWVVEKIKTSGTRVNKRNWRWVMIIVSLKALTSLPSFYVQWLLLLHFSPQRHGR